MKIFKYTLQPPLQPGAVSVVEMPRDARVLSVGAQGSSMVLWAVVDSTQPMVKRRFTVLPTGAEYTGVSMARFVGTVQFQSGAERGLVFHVFERDEATSGGE